MIFRIIAVMMAVISLAASMPRKVERMQGISTAAVHVPAQGIGEAAVRVPGDGQGQGIGDAAVRVPGK